MSDSAGALDAKFDLLDARTDDAAAAGRPAAEELGVLVDIARGAVRPGQVVSDQQADDLVEALSSLIGEMQRSAWAHRDRAAQEYSAAGGDRGQPATTGG